MKFTKMHGLGNDFIFVNTLEENLGAREGYAALAKKLCDRRFSIGGDGLILIEPSETCDFKMTIINSDGSEAEMCGNGIRCFAAYVYEQKLTDKTDLTVETLAGVIKPKLNLEDGKVKDVTVNMGKARLKGKEIPFLNGGEEPVIREIITVDGKKYPVTLVNMGNPHAVIFVESFDEIVFEKEGRAIETSPYFPAKTNVEFVKVESPAHVLVKVWERGAGATLACGTGACAVAVAGNLNGLTEKEVDVTLPGGTLHIAVEDDIFMTGPFETAFTGEVKIE